MKNRIYLVILAVITTGSFVMADIQAPPGSRWNWSRKLSRAVSNIAYGITETQKTWVKSDTQEGSSGAFAIGLVQGTERTVVRLGYGIYELVTFPFPSYHHTYKPPYYKKDYINPIYGYSEFPPQIGMASESGYSRTQNY